MMFCSPRNPRGVFALCLLFVAFTPALFAQQTVFNVPSGDVLDRGKIYTELDVTYRHSDGASGVTPRIVIGVGHSVEAGLNLNGLGSPGPQHATPTPTVKWRFYDGKSNGWTALAGDDVFLPVQNRTYDAGNYFYLELTRTWKHGTRATFGAYHFTRDVVDRAQRAGGQFGIEQPLGKRVTFATDWYTGGHAVGYVTPGVVVKLTPKLSWYGTYQIGNHGLRDGNHQFLFEIGWNPN